MNTVHQLKTIKNKIAAKVEAELSRTGGLLRLAPAWVPRSFLQPGLRIKLHLDDIYAYGLNRGGIDERWFASTTEAASDRVAAANHRTGIRLTDGAADSIDAPALAPPPLSMLYQSMA
jgi:hypothetical protein